ncbi:MAG: hypothetical protein JW797_07940 [Bradymonadales bacterium]|nr:hypothetical protein [Bradymonadales bacterium]
MGSAGVEGASDSEHDLFQQAPTVESGLPELGSADANDIQPAGNASERDQTAEMGGSEPNGSESGSLPVNGLAPLPSAIAEERPEARLDGNGRPIQEPDEATGPAGGEESLPPSVTLQMNRSGGELVTGAYRAVIPELPEAAEVTLAPIRLEEIWQPRPLSAPLAAAELRPYWTITERMFDLTLPLRMELPEGMRVQLLAFNRSMDAFLVADERPVPADGTVRFRTDLFTQCVVIARPEIQETRCIGSTLRIADSVPDAQESEVVGQVAIEERMDPLVARTVLSDMRYFPASRFILFKDEEQRQLDEAGQAPFASEDYLFDPRLAAGLQQVGEHVLAQWTDPISEGPAFQLRLTEGYDSLIEHSPNSNHYRGRAADLTLSPVPAASREARAEYYGRLARLAVCAGFDFIAFEDRFHIHVSVRPTRVAYLEETDGGREIVVCDLDGQNRLEISRLAGFFLRSLDVRSLAFDESGRTLDLYGRQKGEPLAFRFDLVDASVQPIDVPDPLPRSQPFLIIDASLRLQARDGRILIHRPAGSPPGTNRGETWPTEPYTLTPPGVAGWHPAVWNSIVSPARSDVGEPLSEK